MMLSLRATSQWVGRLARAMPVALGPRAYLVVFCSGKNRTSTAPGSRLLRIGGRCRKAD